MFLFDVNRRVDGNAASGGPMDFKQSLQVNYDGIMLLRLALTAVKSA